MVDHVIGGGGRLYKDAREAQNGHDTIHDTFPGEDDDGAVLPGPEPNPEPKSKIHEHSEWQQGRVTAPNAPKPPWELEAPAEPPAPPKPPRDWQQFQSTALELAGVSVLTAGSWMLFPWLGLMVLGVCLILLGVAAGLPDPKKVK